MNKKNYHNQFIVLFLENHVAQVQQMFQVEFYSRVYQRFSSKGGCKTMQKIKIKLPPKRQYKRCVQIIIFRFQFYYHIYQLIFLALLVPKKKKHPNYFHEYKFRNFDRQKWSATFIFHCSWRRERKFRNFIVDINESPSADLFYFEACQIIQ